jgi:hypothetical protein
VPRARCGIQSERDQRSGPRRCGEWKCADTKANSAEVASGLSCLRHDALDAGISHFEAVAAANVQAKESEISEIINNRKAFEKLPVRASSMLSILLEQQSLKVSFLLNIHFSHWCDTLESFFLSQMSKLESFLSYPFPLECLPHLLLPSD